MSGVGKGAGNIFAGVWGDGGAIRAASPVGAGNGRRVAELGSLGDRIRGAGRQAGKYFGAAGVGDGEGAQVAGELPVGCRCGAGDDFDHGEGSGLSCIGKGTGILSACGNG